MLRLLARGPKTEQDQESLRQLQEMVVTRKVENYTRLVERMRQSTREGQKIFIFGTTQQYKELCELILAGKQPLGFQRWQHDPVRRRLEILHRGAHQPGGAAGHDVARASACPPSASWKAIR